MRPATLLESPLLGYERMDENSQFVQDRMLVPVIGSSNSMQFIISGLGREITSASRIRS
jgi:hypothetical protein